MEAESIVPYRSPEPVDLVDPVDPADPVVLVYLLRDMAVLEKLDPDPDLDLDLAEAVE